MLPLISLFANLFLCLFILNINPKNRLNQLLSLFTLSLAIWSIGHYYMFNASSTADALLWKNIPTMGSIFTVIFLFHFTLFFTNNKYASKIIYLLPLYIFGCFLVFIEFTTPFLTESMKITYWGMGKNTAALYPVLSLSVFLLTGFSLIFLTKFFMKSSSTKIKKQTKLFIIGIIFPFIGGFITQVIAPMVGFEIVPVAALLTTITAFFIVFSVFRYSFVRPMSFSIKKKLVVMFFVLIFCLMFFTLTSVSIITKDIMQDTIKNDLSAIAESKAAHIETFLFEQKKTVEDIGCIGKIEQFLLKERNSSEFYDNLNSTVERLQKTVDKNDDIMHISILDTSGIVLASTNSEAVGKNRSSELFFSNGINYTYIDELHLSCENYTVVFCISTPLKDENDDLVGVLLVRFKHDRLYEITTDTTGLGDTGKVYIVNKSGFVLTPLRFHNLSYNYENVILKQKIQTENFYKCMQHQNYTGESFEENKHVDIFEDYRGEKVLGAYAYIDEMQWALLAEIDESEVFSSVNSMQNTLTIIFTISAIFILFIAYFYSKTISSPIEKLESLAKEIAKGNLNINVDVNTSDEIGSLANSFSEMASNLKKYNEKLETQVKKRTEDLQTKVEELEKFKKVTVGRELKMAELKKEIKKLESNKETGGKNFDA